MISKAQIKRVRSLHQKKYRDEEGLFIAEGPKIVNELLSSKYKATQIYAREEYSIANAEHIIQKVSEKELQSISSLTTANQVLGVFEMPSPPILPLSSLASELVLALDDVSDPGNLGAIIRIADWFGITHILCSDACVELFNPKVIQATMGSIARVNVYYVHLSVALQEFKAVYAAVIPPCKGGKRGIPSDGRNIYLEALSDKGVILIGNESRGISEQLMKHVTQKLFIPNFSPGGDSLNAAVATAVICSEFRRR